MCYYEIIEIHFFETRNERIELKGKPLIPFSQTADNCHYRKKEKP